MLGLMEGTHSTVGDSKEGEEHVVVAWRHKLADHCLGVLFSQGPV